MGKRQTIRDNQEFRTQDEVIIPLLARGSFHLPGNTAMQDWIQWMRNNHVLFGTCFHHKLHPIEKWERLLVLLWSVSFAMVATNIGYLLDWYDGDEIDFDPTTVVYSWNIPSLNTTLDLTYGTMILWTFGSTLHSLFDFLVWNLSACACCHPGGRFGKTAIASKCRDLGSYSLIPFVLGLFGLAGYSSYLRLTNGENSALEEEYGDDAIDNWTEGKLGRYSFLVRFAIELALAWFVFFPILSTLFFSGWLGCNGRLPLLGGRPRDKKLVEENLQNTIMVQDSRASHSFAEV